MDRGSRSDDGMPTDLHMACKPRPVTDHDVRTDDAVRADEDIPPDQRARLYAGGWIDRGHLAPHASLAPTSASATTTPTPTTSTLTHDRRNHLPTTRPQFYIA